MKAKKIGPGVYAVGLLGEIEMEQWIIDDRKLHGLPAPAQARHLTNPTPTLPYDPREIRLTNRQAQRQALAVIDAAKELLECLNYWLEVDDLPETDPFNCRRAHDQLQDALDAWAA